MRPKVSGRIYNAKIQFTGSFPMDMLRYEGCYPVSGSDASVIEASISRSGKPPRKLGEHVPIIEVNVAKFSDRPAWDAWCPDRWKSFGCKLELEE